MVASSLPSEVFSFTVLAAAVIERLSATASMVEMSFPLDPSGAKAMTATMLRSPTMADFMKPV